MMICGLDLETTGLSIDTDVPVEIGFVVTETGPVRPLRASSFLLKWPEGPALSAEAAAVNMIDPANIEKFGSNPKDVFTTLEWCLETFGVEAIVAHNGNNFDKPLLGRVFPGVLKYNWIDTSIDVEYPEAIATRKLTHLAAEHKFLNPFPHTALGDIMTMLEILSRYDFDRVLARSKEPSIVVRALVSFDDKEKAKAMSFRWETLGDKKFHKSWVKQIKACDLAALKAKCDFEIGVIPS
jgi:DNA polymerase-3 subunit epsilon